ncbi:MAG: family 16 glycosylhydrolase [Lachnospiraceae bacterium]|nr:family 16 glycosylhydrolase [Lachnospiraceae bacterium]
MTIRKKCPLSVLLTLLLVASSLTGCGKNAPATAPADPQESAAADAEQITEEAEPEEDIEAPADYHLVWHDEFNGDKLSEDDWNYEQHEVGWVNNELQEYIPSDEYAFVKDGELVIQPVKNVDENGKASYISGRVNTQNKHDYKYGWFEARLKVPEGKGFLPAFWMMPQEEEHYGQWPKCGEIDIMEVLGDSTSMNYGTLHFGEPHKQRQGSYTLASGSFSEDYHTFAIEWEPGVIRWFVDGEQYFETSDWFTAVQGEEEKPYPAPFDQPFHVILNVAVGGDWPGDPDESTVFDERAAMRIDYVRIFQKDSYDENVEKPVDELVMREADETGNYLHNWDFAEAEDLTDDVDWKFLQLNGGVGSAEIRDGMIIISTEDFGTEEYSIQLVQPEMPMEKGKKYKLSFEAYADEERQMKPAVTAPDVDWIRYFPDTPIDLTTDWQSFEFEFDMDQESDDNGRVEFNMGNQGSVATIYIRNVRLEQIP